MRLEAPKIINAHDMIELFPVHAETRVQLLEPSSSSLADVKFSSTSTDSLARIIAAANPDATTRALLAKIDPNDKHSVLPHEDLAEGQKRKQKPQLAVDPEVDPEVDHAVEQLSIESLSSYPLALFLQETDECPIQKLDIQGVRDDDLPVDDRLPWTVPEDLGADYSEAVDEGWDDRISIIF